MIKEVTGPSDINQNPVTEGSVIASNQDDFKSNTALFPTTDKQKFNTSFSIEAIW